MKARFLFASFALAWVAQCWALSPTAAIDIQFFMAGATAQKNTFQNLLGGAAPQTVYGFSYPAVPAICAPGTLDFFYDSAKGSNYRAYSCTLVVEGSLPTAMQGKGLGGKNILIHYRLLSGSWIGVGPLSRAQAVTRMAVDGTCSSSATGTAPVPTTFPLANLYNTPSWICTNTTTAVPDVGVSDQEPAIFYAANAPNDGHPTNNTEIAIKSSDLANILSAPLQGVQMNVIATKKLINAMQIAQGKGVTAAKSPVPDADRPNITSPQISALLTNNGGAYNVDWQPLVGTAGTNMPVHVCRRISAVGTQIAANSFWLNYPCAATAILPPTGPVYPSPQANVVTVGNSGANGPGVYNSGTYTITEANLIPDMRTCVAHYNNADQTGLTAADTFAIGLLFTDNDPGTSTDAASVQFAWDFLAIDGIQPNVANGVSGAYRFVTTETWQYRIKTVNAIKPLTDASNASQFNLVTGLFAMLETPAVLAVQPGFLAVPENGYVPGTDGNNIWKGTTAGPNACNPPLLFF